MGKFIFILFLIYDSPISQRFPFQAEKNHVEGETFLVDG